MSSKPFFPPESHRRVLADCPDVPRQRPSFPIALDQVGIGAKTVWVKLPAGFLPFALNLSVALAAELRGIHMSRLEEAISDLHQREFSELQQYALELARLSMAGQQASRGRVELTGSLPRLSQTGVSELSSLDSLDLKVTVAGVAGAAGPDCTVRLEVGVYHITACPCTQAYNRLLFPGAGGAVAPGRDSSTDLTLPLPTHSQRSRTRLALTVPAGEPWPDHEQLLACLDGALHLSQDLLKRPDEAELVYAAHHRPQFAEDAVRETARVTGELLGPRFSPATRVEIETVGFESIHIHDVHCRIDTTLAALYRG
ncbi:MAG TPA: hypothetical protein ENN98_00855 [Desulfurivibrio alkaliphilus]|uniref:GTP cyclohydrolase I FolE2 n=1 Tax=Desulfurivibrio alkaliphilus TaxID=427923 RepID=A0A7C2X9A3_9BACT|nr:hypothetical protein [Desulfurivibrio alkaliphilus]